MIYQAFFDAGGDASDPNVRILCVAGWIAPERRWEQLSDKWREVCRREGVNGLHMKEFAHSRGEFAAWRGDEERRGRFLADLARIIHTYTNRDFSQTFFLDGYRTVDVQYEFHERIGYPYPLCAIRCIQQVRSWMAKTHPRDDVMFIFEKGDSHQGQLIDILRRDKICLGIDPLFLDKRATPALECADFLAYEQHKTMTDALLKGKTTVRTSSWAVQGMGRHFREPGRGNPILDGMAFEALALGFDLPRRPGVIPAPVPRELVTMKGIMPDNMHGNPSSRRLRIRPRAVPLGRVREP